MLSTAQSANQTTSEAIPKRIAVVNDLSGFGRCSLALQLPLLSVLGLQCCPLPTAILSSHCGFDRFFFDDYTEKIPSYLAEWKHLQLTFDGVYTGFLGSAKQIDIVRGFIQHFAKKALVLVDPVMGDDGMIPPPYTDSLCDQLKQLVAMADLITPNLTEAARLADMPYCPEPDDETLFHMATRLLSLGCQTIVITGILRSNQMGNLIIRPQTAPEWVWTESVGERRVGTGDLFSSLLMGRLLQGYTLREAVCESAAFVSKAMRYSKQHQIPIQDGIAFEPLLSSLLSGKEFPHAIS